ncbi:hypothetical protein SEA_FRANCOB_249 [Streptomyces phage Francob]|uniref:Uncharacterized protein n=1 Tax=Streptomyces phage Gilson TaxID=2488789 RepID=A0A3T0ID21_9CAUD|nr:membrane protein [Streptomyces phage Gilson]AZU97290.1 hypothetical protein SEA_GILSON_245 [Streptomyces phage Gilson]
MKKSTLFTTEAVLSFFMFFPNAIVSVRYMVERDVVDASSTAFAGVGLFFLVLFGLLAIDAKNAGQ